MGAKTRAVFRNVICGFASNICRVSTGQRLGELVRLLRDGSAQGGLGYLI